MYFNVNLKLLTKLINSAFVGECVNYVEFKMHGATIKKKRGNTFFIQHAKRMRHIFISWLVWLYCVFPHHLIDGMIFRFDFLCNVCLKQFSF